VVSGAYIYDAVLGFLSVKFNVAERFLKQSPLSTAQRERDGFLF
jgi:hypothetical protein